MKKMKLTFWLLGFGCGLIVAGILLTWVVLQLDYSESLGNTVKQQPLLESNSELSSEVAQDSLQAEGVHEEEQELDTTKVPIDEVEEASDLVESIEGKGEIEPLELEKAISFKNIFIPPTSGATQICILLEEAGVIESAQDFLIYIESRKLQTRLKDGHLEVPYPCDYETLLDFLSI